MITILYLYIKGKGRKSCQEVPHLPVELSSAAKVQDGIVRFNMIKE